MFYTFENLPITTPLYQIVVSQDIPKGDIPLWYPPETSPWNGWLYIKYHKMLRGPLYIHNIEVVIWL